MVAKLTWLDLDYFMKISPTLTDQYYVLWTWIQDFLRKFIFKFITIVSLLLLILFTKQTISILYIHDQDNDNLPLKKNKTMIISYNNVCVLYSCTIKLIKSCIGLYILCWARVSIEALRLCFIEWKTFSM